MAHLTLKAQLLDPTVLCVCGCMDLRWPDAVTELSPFPYLWLEGRKAAWAASLRLNVSAPSPLHHGSHGALLHLFSSSRLPPSPPPPALSEQLPLCDSVSLSPPSPPASFVLNPPGCLSSSSTHTTHTLLEVADETHANMLLFFISYNVLVSNVWTGIAPHDLEFSQEPAVSSLLQLQHVAH